MNNDLIHVNTLPPFKRLCMTIGELPTSYLETMTYYEMLVWFTEYMKNTVIPTINNNGEAVEELQGLYIQLKSYVDNYFDNLDVQEEINNKLDDMAESGQLTDIIAQYLGLAGVFSFNTVSDMKAAENLVNGSTIKTLGYHTLNDNGGAFYKVRTITNEDTVDEMNLIALHDVTLVAELIKEKILNVKQFGAKGDGVQDDTSKIQAAINTERDVFIPSGNYKVTSTITISTNNQQIKSAGDAYIFPATAFDVFYIKEGRINLNINVNGSEVETADNTKYVITIGQNGINAALCVINNCELTHLKQGGIKWEHGSMIHFNNLNIFEATGKGIYTTTNYNDNNHGLFDNVRITSCDIGLEIEKHPNNVSYTSQYNVFNNVKCFGCVQNFKIGGYYNYGTIFSEDSTNADELLSGTYGNELIYMGDQTESSRCVDNGNNTISFYSQSSARTYKDMYFKSLRLKYGSGADGYRELSNNESRVYEDKIIGSNVVTVNYSAENSGGTAQTRTDNFKKVTATHLTTTAKLKIGNTELSSEIERLYKSSVNVGNVTFAAGETKTFSLTYLGVNATIAVTLANGSSGLVCSTACFSGQSVLYITNITANSITTNGSCTANYIGIY